MVGRATRLAGSATIDDMTTQPEDRFRKHVHWDPDRAIWATDYAALEADISRDLAEKRTGVTAFEAEVARVAGRAAAEVMVRTQSRGPRDDPPRPRSSWAGVHHRVAEHEVLAGDPNAATVSGALPALTVPWVLDLAAEWTTAAMPVTAQTGVVEIDPSRGMPAVPTVTSTPTPGPQGGQKTEAVSDSFTVGAATTTTIDSTLYLNFSLQLEATVAAEVGRAMMQAAVADAADRQVAAAIVADGTAAATIAAGFAHFDSGRFLPNVLLLPPGEVGATGLPAATDLAALGVRTVLAHVAKPVLLTRGAVTGWLAPLQATAPEPTLLGNVRAYAMFGQVAVDPAGVSVIG